MWGIAEMKFIPFMIKFSAIFIFLDFYFLFKLKKYVQDNNWNRYFYIVPFIIGFLMLFVTFENVWIQVADYVPSSFEKTLFTLKSLWYLPKALIVIPMIISDIIKITVKIIKGEKNFVTDNFTHSISFVKNQFKFLASSTERIFGYEPSLQANMNIVSQSGLTDSTEANYDKIYMESETSDEKTEEAINNKPESRRKFLRNSTWALAGVPFVIVGKGVLDTRNDFQFHESDIFLPQLDSALDGMRIIQISDIHAGSFQSANPIHLVRKLINEQKADAIVLTGDFVNFNHNELDMAMADFKQLKSDIGIYGCLGNHDHFMSEAQHKILKEKIKSTGIDLLVNESRTLVINGAKLNIAGNDNTGYGQFFGDFDKTLAACDTDAPTILLCHDPTNWDAHIRGKRNVDLMLSGHTHGGQIGFEMFGEIITPARIAYKQFAGHYIDKSQHLYINRGLGTTGPPVRVGVNPEITILTLRSRPVA